MLLRMLVALMLMWSSAPGSAQLFGQVDANLLLHLLNQSPEKFGSIIAKPELYRPQIIYTQISRDENSRPLFKTFKYRVNKEEYFYPASTVKLPVALFALEKLQRLRASGIDCQTIMVVSSYPETQQSICDDIQQIFEVSDNLAYNRLFDFVGHDELAWALANRGYERARIVHRVGASVGDGPSSAVGAIAFYRDGYALLKQERRAASVTAFDSAKVLLGRAEVVNGELVSGAKDFSEKNKLSLLELHNMIKALVFPSSVPSRQGFEISQQDRDFILQAMASYPSDTELPQGYVKFLLFGGEEKVIPETIKIYNKVGQAYGFVTDGAYVVDEQYGLEFLLVASIYTNQNDVFNDDVYEYDTVALPFLRDLGQAILDFERSNQQFGKRSQE